MLITKEKVSLNINRLMDGKSRMSIVKGSDK
jgi:hypothetical protein